MDIFFNSEIFAPDKKMKKRDTESCL